MKYEYNASAEKEFKRTHTFKRKPKGVIIFDSYNNRFFPLKIVRIDKVDFNFRIIKDEFHRTYGGSASTDLFMPWHYSVELIGKNYFPINTRPIMYKSLIPDYEEYITICITGDSEIDIYSNEFYKVISHLIINSLHYLPGWRMSVDDLEFLDLGKGFKEANIIKNMR